MNYLMLIAGVLLLINSLQLCTMLNLTSGTALTFLAGVFFMIWGIFYHKIAELTSCGILKYLKIFIICLMCAEALLLTFIAIYGQKDNVTYTEDAIIVLGAGLKGERVTLTLQKRLDKAIEYHQKNPDALIIVSGGQGFQETVTEASAMKKYLVDKGIPSEKVIEEGKSTSTNENMRFSKEILDKIFAREYKTSFVTNNFHIYRSTQIAKHEGIKNITHIHTDLQWYNIVQCYLRESLAIIKMWILG